MGTPITDTPLQLNVVYAEFHDVNVSVEPLQQQSLKNHAVVGPAVNGKDPVLTSFGQDLSSLAGKILSAEAQTDPTLQTQLQNLADPASPLTALLASPSLQDQFAAFLNASKTQDHITTSVITAIKSSGQANTGKNFVVHIPTSGTLSAAVAAIEPRIFPDLFNYYGKLVWVSGSQLELTFSVPGFSASWTNVNGIFGADWNISFDGELVVYLAIATDPRIPPQAQAVFNTSNTKASPGNFNAGVAYLAGFIVDFVFTLIPFEGLAELLGVTNPPVNLNLAAPNQSQQVPGISALTDSLLSLWLLFKQAYSLGFTELRPVVTVALPEATPGNTVQLDLIHPLNGPPTLSLSGTKPSLGILEPELAVAPPVVAPAGQFTVSFLFFPPSQSEQLIVQWTDTWPFVQESSVLWGPAGAGNTPPAVADYNSSGPLVATYDNYGTYTFTTLATPGKPQLVPDTTYAFIAQDFDLPSLVLIGNSLIQIGIPPIAHEQSAWTFFTTSASDQIRLVLDYNDTLLGVATLQTGSATFSGTFVMPSAVPPGSYTVTAFLGTVQLAQAPISVVASAEDLVPVLQVINPATGVAATGICVIWEASPVTVQGFNFPPGPINLYVDRIPLTVIHGSPPAPLGTANANANGYFTATVTWPMGTSGSHVVLAEGSSGGKVPEQHATAPVLAYLAAG